MRREMIDQRGAPGIAAAGVAERVERQHHPAVDPKLFQQLVGEAEQFDIGERLGGADHLGVQLVELAITALLRTLVTEQRTRGRDLHRRVLLPAVGEIGARDPGGEFGTQRDRIPAAIVERIHFLRYDVGRFAQTPREHRGRLDHRHFDALEAVQPPDAVERIDHVRETLLCIAVHVLGAAHGMGGRKLRHGPRPSASPPRPAIAFAAIAALTVHRRQCRFIGLGLKAISFIRSTSTRP